MRIVLFFLCLCLALLTRAQQTIKLEIAELPAKHPNDGALFIAGSFNGWNPQNEEFKFQQDEKGVYFISLKLNPGNYEFKVTRGGWNKVECSKEGRAIGNRQLKVDADASVTLHIDGWEDQFAATSKKSTASHNVKIIADELRMPQLDRTRRIWIYLPGDYKASKLRYPVLYMHDGQNLFEDSSSFSGEWGVDEFLDSIKQGKCIVIGIDNGKEKRMNEYNPYNHERFGKGEGDAYVDFIVKTLKPYIDKHYRTRKNKKNTMIAGSSMGGLISMYAVLKYPKVFGGAGVFSPAFWTAPKIFEELSNKNKKINSNLYFFAGKLEGEQMVTDMLKAMEKLSEGSKSKIKTVIRDEGRHNEATWRSEFPGAYSWMFGN